VSAIHALLDVEFPIWLDVAIAIGLDMALPSSLDELTAIW